MGKRRDRYNEIAEAVKKAVNDADIRISFRSYIIGYNRYVRRYKPDHPKLTKAMKKDYINYYKSFGFKHIKTDWIKYIYAVTGRYDKRYIPDDIFNLYIDYPYYVDREFWQNKAFQPEIFPEARYPETVIKRLNGYYYNQRNERISLQDAARIVKNFDETVIKHTVGGGGTNISFFKSSEIDEEKLDSVKHDYVVQKIIKQSPLMAQFNESSVNIIKITSFLFKGQVHILSSRLWAGGKGYRLSNSSGSTGYQVVVNEDGSLNETGFNLGGKCPSETEEGVKFSSIKLDFYKECVELVKKGHERLIYFPFISWDFTQDCEGNTILIEYNLKWHVLCDFQILTGPAFGNITDEVLKEAAKSLKKQHPCDNM